MSLFGNLLRIAKSRFRSTASQSKLQLRNGTPLPTILLSDALKVRQKHLIEITEIFGASASGISWRVIHATIKWDLDSAQSDLFGLLAINGGEKYAQEVLAGRQKARPGPPPAPLPPIESKRLKRTINIDGAILKNNLVYSAMHPVQAVTSSTISDDGLRYSAKAPGSTFGTLDSVSNMSCMRCSVHKPRSMGSYRNMAGTRQFVCYACKPASGS